MKYCVSVGSRSSAYDMKHRIRVAAAVVILVAALFLQPIPQASAVPSAGDYLVTELNGNVLARITPAGLRGSIFSFAGGTAPTGVVADSAGNYIVAESGLNVVSRITQGGARTVVYDYSVSGPAGARPVGLALGVGGNYIVAEGNAHVISRITPAGARTVVYDYAVSGPAGAQPTDVAIDSAGNYIVTEASARVISKITTAGARTVVYDYVVSGPPGAVPAGVAVDSAGNYIVAEVGPDVISRITPAGARTVVYDYTTFGPPGAMAQGLAVDSAGNYIVAEYGSNMISKITPAGGRTVVYDYTVSGPAVAGPARVFVWPTPAPPNVGDYIVTQFGYGALSRIVFAGGGTTLFLFSPSDTGPEGLAIDSAGNYIIAEWHANAISKITSAGARTVVYDYTVSGPVGAGPSGVAIDLAGDYIVTEFTANVISKITPAGARTVVYNYAASGPAGAAPVAVAIDSAGNYVIAESNANVLSKITPAGVRTQILSFAAGSALVGVAIDSGGNYIVAEWGASKLSRVTPGGARTVVYDYAASGPAGAKPNGVAIDSAGNYIVTETGPALAELTPAGVRVPIFIFPPNAAPFGVAVVKAWYQLTIQASPAGGGSTNPSLGTYSRESGSFVDITQTPAAGFIFDHWDLDGTSVGSAASYTVSVDASHTLTAVFHEAVAADFTILADPASLSLGPGTSKTSTIRVQSVGTFSSAVTLSSSGAPGGLTLVFGTNPITPPAGGTVESVLTVTASGAPTGSYTVTITGTSGASTHDAVLTVQVTGGGGGCLIATATYGSELSDEVQFLRNFRDNSILRTNTGSTFMIAFNAWYYSFSPFVAQFIREHSLARTVTKVMLYPLMGILRLGAAAFYIFPENLEAGAVMSGLLVSSLIGMVYLSPPLAAVFAYSPRVRRMAKRLEVPMVVVMLGAVAGVTFIATIGAPQIFIMLSTATIVLATLAASALYTSRAILRLAGRV